MLTFMRGIKTMTKYECGHETEILILDYNPLTISAYLEWVSTVGRDGTKKLCWNCWCKERKKNE